MTKQKLMQIACFLIFAAFLFIPGCTSGQIPINAESMNVTQNNDEVLVRVIFSGNSIPEEVNGTLSLMTLAGEPVYGRDFVVKRPEFRNTDGKVVLDRYVKLDTDRKFDYAELTLYLQNQTFHATQGEMQTAVELDVEAIAHETQYTVHVSLVQNGKKKTATGQLDLQIIDNERQLYNRTIYVNGAEFKDGLLTIFLPYSQIPESFYGTGNLLIRFQNMEKRINVQLRQFTEPEKRTQEEKEFTNHLTYFNNYTDYVGFRFNTTRAGYYYAYLPERAVFVRFDTKLKNLLGRPQYLIRNDFYIKDNEKNFYPVYIRLSTPFGPLLKAQEETTASFYFNIISSKRSYSFYYGDKKLAEFSGK